MVEGSLLPPRLIINVKNLSAALCDLFNKSHFFNFLVYLRKIAKNLNIPIFAIDYRLAPKTKFPNNFEDVLASIFWIFQFVRDVLKTEIKEYILMGDSAGGSLCVSVCQWLIESDIDLLPSMLSLSYPALSCRYGLFFFDRFGGQTVNNAPVNTRLRIRCISPTLTRIWPTLQSSIFWTFTWKTRRFQISTRMFALFESTQK